MTPTQLRKENSNNIIINLTLIIEKKDNIITNFKNIIVKLHMVTAPITPHYSTQIVKILMRCIFIIA